MLSLVPRPKIGRVSVSPSCPIITHYMGDQYFNQGNTQVLAVVTVVMQDCISGPGMDPQQEALTALREALLAGDTDNEYTYRALEDSIRHMSGMPGERVIVLVSPGLLVSTLNLDEMGIIDRANRASIVINTVDARGLYTPELAGGIESRGDPARVAGPMDSYRQAEQFEDEFVMIDFANGTGGTFFHNGNDLQTGLRLAGAAPELSYVLGFSPLNQRMDGRFHSLKVVIVGKQNYDIKARRGYYAPKKLENPEEQVKAEMEEAVFSQDEIEEIPLELETQYFKTSETEAHVSVVSHIDVKGIHFRKADGRNYDSLTIDTAIFDDNGNLVSGVEKHLELRLLDATYDKLSHTGLMVKTGFDLKPGQYMVRQVVRDSEGAQMAAKNGSVVISD